MVTPGESRFWRNLISDAVTTCTPNVFVFGPYQSFIAYISDVYSTSSNFSPEITAVLAVDNIKSLNFVAFPGSANGADTSSGRKVAQAYIGYHKKHGLKTSGLICVLPNKTLELNGLEEWVKKQDKKTEGVEVVCNGKGGFWTRVSQGEKTKVFNQGLALETRQWLKSSNPHGASPTCVALGVNDSYIIVYEDKHVTWDLKGCYEGLDKRLSQVLATSTKLFYVALNPYHEDE
jgi:hypothetical protein